MLISINLIILKIVDLLNLILKIKIKKCKIDAAIQIRQYVKKTK